MNQELQNIVRKAIENDRSAQKELYNQYAPRLLSVCRQYMSNIQEAEDVMVTSFMKIFSNLTSFQEKGSFESWIRRIAINQCLSQLRLKHKTVYGIDDFEIEDNGLADENLYVEDIQSLIDQLPVSCKTVFNLYAVEGYKHSEIAGMLGINEGTSKSQLAYARKLLKQSMHHHSMADYE
jgi:RNA polymerase sigma-70 factor (ECF subfamily)